MGRRDRNGARPTALYRPFPDVPHAHRLVDDATSTHAETVAQQPAGSGRDGRVYVPRWVVLILLAGIAILGGSMAHSIADQVQRTIDMRAVDAQVPVATAPLPQTTAPAAAPVAPAAPAAPAAGGTTNIYLTIVNSPDGATSTQDRVVIPGP
jgi:hypothetical protein